jgi:pimeloyl-ACP methyl ester carboxylesterase
VTDPTIVVNDLTLPDGRVLHWYDTAPGRPGPVVVWHHGTPGTGTPPAPLFDLATSLGVRWLGHDRPGYGGSDPQPDRDIAAVAADVAAVADAAGVDSFGLLGHSGGGPHLLACAALLPDRVRAAVCMSGAAPYGPAGFDFFDGMGPVSTATFRSALAGRAARTAFEDSPEGARPDFLPADWAALQGDWSWFVPVVQSATPHGPGPCIDDDLAFVGPWGFDPSAITVPTLLLHGGDDLVVPAGHSRWLAGAIGGAELRVTDGDGHLSVLAHAPDALRWLVSHW